MKNPAGIKPALQTYPLFLFTIPFAFLINTANYYYKLLHWEYIITDILLYLAIPVIAYFLLGKLWRSYAKAGVLLCVLLIIFYFFHLLYEGLQNIAALSFMARYAVLLPALLAGLLLLVIYLYRGKSNFQLFYYIMNLLFILLVAGGIIQYIFLIITNPVAKYDQADPSKSILKNFTPCDTCERPDIYFIIFDSYTHSTTLEKEFGYQNAFIENKLQQDGFLLPSESNSNYNFTHMSLGSELNLNYLQNLKVDHRFYTKDFLEANYTIFNNELCAILSKEGYEINNYSIFDIKDAPVKVTKTLTELTWRSVLGQTFFNKLKRDIGWHLARFYAKDHIPAGKQTKFKKDIKRISETFEGIVAAAKKSSSKPRFVYAHFLMPHETFYFDSSGNRLDERYTSNAVLNKIDYLNQVIYTNKFVMAPVIDSIFRYARKPSVIIIQGDHGYRNYAPDKVSLEFENFSAIYFPDKNYSALNGPLSSVNTFRIVLNKYFGQNLPLLKDTMINLYKHNSY